MMTGIDGGGRAATQPEFTKRPLSLHVRREQMHRQFD